VPQELRGLLLSIYLQHARGALQWVDRQWRAFDTL
jgi:hypothetical protein